MALNITRKPDQGILITNDETGEIIDISVIDISKGQVRLAIEAGHKYFILRKELEDK